MMDIDSSVSGASEAFNLLPAAVEEAEAESQDVGGSGGVVGDMNLAMLIVACICGETY